MGETKTLKDCRTCGKSLKLDEFYVSSNKFDRDGRLSICKSCLKDNVDYNNIQTVKDTLLNINRPFIYSIWQSAKEEAETKNSNHFGLYMKSIGMKDFKELTWNDSDEKETTQKPNKTITEMLPPSTEEDSSQEDQEQIEFLETSNKNKQDVIRLIGYDPFIYEKTEDRPLLYNRLVDYLDDATLEDSLKLPSVIEIVKTFGQVDKINNAITTLNSDIDSLVENPGKIKSLGDAKDKLLKSVLALAKDNGISENHNNKKSKGAGTLSGIIKELQEKGFEEANVNVFDIDTTEGMRQVADISHKSIINQLQFDENDYAEMISEQREKIVTLENDNSTLKEENRNLKITLKDYGEIYV